MNRVKNGLHINKSKGVIKKSEDDKSIFVKILAFAPDKGKVCPMIREVIARR